jgi:hypothetical protein
MRPSHTHGTRHECPAVTPEDAYYDRRLGEFETAGEFGPEWIARVGHIEWWGGERHGRIVVTEPINETLTPREINVDELEMRGEVRGTNLLDADVDRFVLDLIDEHKQGAEVRLHDEEVMARYRRSQDSHGIHQPPSTRGSRMQRVTSFLRQLRAR